MGSHRRMLAALNRAVGSIAALCLLTLSLLLFVNIIARNVLKQSYIGTETLAMYLMVWMTFLGAAVILPKYGHVSVDLMLRMAHGRVWLRRTIGIVMFACATVVCCYFVVHGSLLTYELFASGGDVPSLGISQGYIYLVVTVGMVVMLLNCLDMLIGILCGDESRYPPTDSVQP